MTNAALVNASGIVENRITYNPATGFQPPSGLTLINETPATGNAHIGLGWNGSVFEQPVPLPPPPPTVDEQRRTAIRNDQSVMDLGNRIGSMTAAEIDAWFQANVTTLAQARGAMATIVKLLATRL